MNRTAVAVARILISLSAPALIGLAVAAPSARAAAVQNTHDQNLAWCKSDDIDRKMSGCSALINSGEETPATLAIAYLNRGNALSQNGQIDLAIHDYDESLKRDATNAEALGARGCALAHKGDFDRALTDLDASLKMDPKNAKALASRGFARSRKKDFDGAIADYSAALKLDPNDAATFRLRAAAYRETAQYDLAIQDSTRALDFDPNDAVAYYIRGVSKQKKGDKSGKADITKAKELDPKIDRQ